MQPGVYIAGACISIRCKFLLSLELVWMRGKRIYYHFLLNRLCFCPGLWIGWMQLHLINHYEFFLAGGRLGEFEEVLFSFSNSALGFDCLKTCFMPATQKYEIC